MNRHYISRFVLMIVLLLGVCARGWADGETVILSENFETREVSKMFGDGFSSPDGWLFYGCSISGDYEENRCLVLNNSYCKTPTFTVDSEVMLSFCYSYSSTTTTAPENLRLTVSVSSGTIEGTTSYSVSDFTMTPVSVKIKGNNINTRVTFTASGPSKNVFIDNIVISIPPTPVDLTLSSSESNATTLSDNAGKLANVTLGRTFPANTWCTLCLPFDVTASSIGTACGTDAPQLRVFYKVEGNTMKFTPPENDAVSAGTPFLLKFTTAVTSNPVFNGVTISKTGDAVTPAATVTHEGYEDYSFIGTYSPTEIPAAGWFLKADGKLYQPGPETVGGDVNRTLPGLRAYFTLPTTTSGARPVVSIADDNATTVGAAASVAPSVEAIYTLGGLPVASPKSPGIYIVRRTDGSTQKITIR